MRFTDFDLLISSFQKRYPDKDFYEVVLRYVVQKRRSTSNYGSIDPEQYRELHKIVYRQSERHPEISPWIIADAVVSCCIKYGVAEFIQDYTAGGMWFDAELRGLLCVRTIIT